MAPSELGLYTMIQRILNESGYKTNSVSTDEDGDSHRIDFSQECNNGNIHTCDGKITHIEGNRRGAQHEVNMTAQQIIEKWNQSADEYNQWDILGEDEKLEFAFLLGRKASDACGGCGMTMAM